MNLNLKKISESKSEAQSEENTFEAILLMHMRDVIAKDLEKEADRIEGTKTGSTEIQSQNNEYIDALRKDANRIRKKAEK